MHTKLRTVALVLIILLSSAGLALAAPNGQEVMENVYNRSSGSEDAFRKTVSWIAKDKWIGLKREYYDENGQVYKTLHIDEFEQIDGYWVITNMIMKDLDRSHSTRLEMENVKFDTGLTDSFFSERQMQRGPRR